MTTITIDLQTNRLTCHDCGEIQIDTAPTLPEFERRTAQFFAEHTECAAHPPQPLALTRTHELN